MGSSDPFIRQAVIAGLAGNDKIVRGANLRDIKVQLGLSDISNSAFDAAIGSLAYNYGLITWNRFWDPNDMAAQTRCHALALVR